MTQHPDVSVRPGTRADAPGVAEIWRLGWRDAHLGAVPEQLAVVAANTRARRFYERCGWMDAEPFEYAADAGPNADPIPVPCHRYIKDLADH